MAKMTEIPSSRLITTDWNADKIESFLKSLKKGTFFGFSSGFSLSYMLALAETYGMDIETLEEKHPLFKKYNTYVLRVVSPFSSNRKTRIRSYLNQIYCLERRPSPGNRKCRGKDCTHTIKVGEFFIEITYLDELTHGRKVYNKESLCKECASTCIKNKVKNLLILLEISDKKRESVFKIVDNL